MAAEHPLFKVIFANQGQVYEVFARGVSQGGLLGFVEIEDLVFGDRGRLVVDPSEERLRTEFEGVKRFYLPMHAVIRIDEVDKGGVPRIRPEEKDETGKAKVTPFPVPSPPHRGPTRL
jgi:hypothetical protein